MSFRRIAKELGISPDTVINRYLALQKQGVITASTVVIDPRRIGYQAMAVFMIDALPTTVSAKNSVPYDFSSILRRLIEMPGVFFVMRTVGDYDLFATVLARDFEHLTKVGNDISRILGIKDLEVSFWTGISGLPQLYGSMEFYLSSAPIAPSDASCEPKKGFDE